MSGATADLLANVTQAISNARIRVIDLSQTLSPSFPQIVLPPEFDPCAPFRMEQISRYDESGPAWYWNNISFGEHTGTHFDAPVHWVTGRDLPAATTDALPTRSFIAPACVVDCSSDAARNADFLLTADRLRAWENQHGRIPEGAWLLMRTDWSKRSDPIEYQNFDASGQHSPGPDISAVEFLVHERGVIGFGSETIGTDAGQAAHFRPPYPCHAIMHGNGRLGLQCLTNLDLLPPQGAVVIAAPLKILHGSGSPVRALALVED
jgi:kynurenine formamidase